MIEKEEEERVIRDMDFNLTEKMNKKIVGLLRLKNNDIVAMYAAKLIEYYQCSADKCEALYVAGGERNVSWNKYVKGKQKKQIRKVQVSIGM